MYKKHQKAYCIHNGKRKRDREKERNKINKTKPTQALIIITPMNITNKKNTYDKHTHSHAKQQANNKGDGANYCPRPG